MRISIGFIFVTGLVLTQGTPIDPNGTIYLTSDAEQAVTGQSLNPNGVITIQAANERVDECGISTLENQTSSASPLVSDCQVIAKNIANGGRWEVNNFGAHH
ncbi:hypothetical protein FE257_008156 [Aspergillus nanangensis]|uniref:Ecp2 effector protein-like domain-containing protein n=1 Tax=Aspergillus nanangensis TaxID=2582783 RepID=A0AAD4GTU0_ASPNN|nr:hypothetical protein FE257_008156 [Aspergillus nanangensis]